MTVLMITLAAILWVSLIVAGLIHLVGWAFPQSRKWAEWLLG